MPEARGPAPDLVPEDFARDSAAPLHSQISDQFRARIAAGDWPAHYRLKSEPDLARELGVSRGTLRRALSTLIEEGLLHQTQGKGTFVTPATIEPAIAQRLSTLSEDLLAQGVDSTIAVLSCGLVVPPKPVGALLDMPRGGSSLELVRTRAVSGSPVALLSNYVRSDLAPGIESIDFTHVGLFAALEGAYGLKIASARRTFSAEAATAVVAEALGMVEGAPVQYLQQVSYLSDGTPIEYSDVWIDSTRLRVTSNLNRR